MDKFDLKKYIAEGKILKEDTTKFPEYEEGKTFLERNEFLKTHNRYLKDLSKEEYDFYVENGEDAFFDKYSYSSDEFSFIERPKEFPFEEDEYKIVVDDIENYIDENKSANQLKEDTSKYPEFKEGDVWELKKKEYWDKVEYYETADPNTMTKEQYNFLIKNGVDEYFEKYDEEWENIDYSETEADKEEIILVSNNGDEFNIK